MNEERGHYLRQLGMLYRRLRIERKLRQRDVAVRLGVSVDTVRAMERGAGSVAIETWLALAELLGVARPWEKLLQVPVDPFEEYDRKRKEEAWLEKTRVRR
ncbi:helix-turn-helix domain-containing protein [Desulfurivibrio sp. D14AmB]|uniref:helix-turn-helix domain-containing protein n=1 Tax=Desulfurivibrio sp. D14AmB TaxID=3374370 RepID=UPI00376F1DB9